MTSHLFILLALGAAVTIGLVSVFLGSVTAIKGGYVLLAILLAGFLYTTEGESERESKSGRRLNRWSVKLIAILAGGAYLSSYVFGTRLLAVVVALSVGYLLVGYQIVFCRTTKPVVPQLAVLFTISPVTKYLSTGFYYGETDLLGHVRAIEVLYRTGRVEAIAPAYATYDSFPALHLTAGAVSSFVGLPAYDSLLVLGILVYTTAVLTVFYLGRDLLSSSKSVMVVFVLSTSSIVHNYTTYFFPQAFATALIVALFYVTFRRESVPDRLRPLFSLLVVVVAIAFAFTHHVIQLLLVGMVAVLYAPSLLRKTRTGRKLGINDALPEVVPILFVLTAGFTHLVIVRTAIIGYFVQFTTGLASNPFVSDTGGERTVYGLGTEIPYHTSRTAFESLFHVDGLYFIGLTALFVAGVVAVLTHHTRYARIAGVVLLGFGSVVAVLRTPFLNTIARLGLPLTLFFAVVAGVGLWQLLGRNGSDPERRVQVPLRRLGVVILIVTVGVTGPLVAADDLYGLHAGPNLWETYSTPEQQVEFSEQELGEFEAMTQYVDEQNPKVTMLWVSREASGRFGEAERSAPTTVSEQGIRAETPLVYRTKWTEHQVGYSTDSAGTLAMADWWLYREINATSKVYTTGSVGVVWEQDIELSNMRNKEQ